MFGSSRISIHWSLGLERRMVQTLTDFCVERIGWQRASTLEPLPDSLRRDVGLLPREEDLPPRDSHR
jgi:hypothetical protein